MEITEVISNNIIQMPIISTPETERRILNAPKIPTPKSNKIIAKAKKLKTLSKYPCNFDFETYRKLELRFSLEQPTGYTTFTSPFRFIDNHNTCQQDLYAFEVDTYGKGCVYNYTYCCAKEEPIVHDYWNKPFPIPVDLTEIWKVFYTIFETDKKSKWRKIMEKKTPIKIGSMSDSFMFMDKKYKVSQELLKILDFYQYPYIIFTRSDLVAHDEYLNLLNPDLCSVQMSIASTNDELNKKIEPGIPSAKRRLKALQKLAKNNFWTTVRLDPFFPIYPDGYFTDPNYDKKNMFKPFHFSSFEMVDEIAEHGVQSIHAEMAKVSSFSLNQIESAVGYNLRCFYKNDTKKDKQDFYYSNQEVRAYYQRIHTKCIQNKIEFTTCYIRNGETYL